MEEKTPNLEREIPMKTISISLRLNSQYLQVEANTVIIVISNALFLTVMRGISSSSARQQRCQPLHSHSRSTLHINWQTFISDKIKFHKNSVIYLLYLVIYTGIKTLFAVAEGIHFSMLC